MFMFFSFMSFLSSVSFFGFAAFHFTFIDRPLSCLLVLLGDSLKVFFASILAKSSYVLCMESFVCFL